MERTVKQGAEAAYDAGISVAEMVKLKQEAYGDASGIQHAIWKALLAQYLAPAQIRNDLEEWNNPMGHYVIPVELMDHIPRLTRVFDRICRIVSNPAQDRMGEDPWRDLAGDALCGIVMPRTKPEWKTAPDEEPDFDVTGASMGDDPNETAIEHTKDPHPADTRIWNEGAATVSLPRNPVAQPDPADVARKKEYAERAAARRVADAALAERSALRESAKILEG